MSIDVDVIVVGAGAAGIAAAIELQSTKLTFLVFEARERVGGRAHTDHQTFTPTRIDLGASWIHSYGLNNVLYNYHRTLKTDEDKSQTGGRAVCLDYDGQPFSRETMIQAMLIYSRLDEQLELYALDKNNGHDQSIDEVMREKYEQLVPASGPVKRLVDLYLSGGEQYDAGNFTHLSAKQWGVGAAEGGDHWVSFGYGNLIERITAKHQLPIRLNTSVTQIDTTDSERIAVMTSNDSSVIYCRRVIITVPLGCLKRETIVFQPPLPDWKRQAIAQMGIGLMNKLVIQFPDTFWGEDIRSLSHACNERRGRFRFTLCLPPPDNILILFVTGAFAHELEALTDAEILEHVMKFLRRIFPKETIPNPINYKFTRWAQDPHAYGSYSNFVVHTGPHTIEQLAKETSDGRVQWAGEHANVNDGSEDWSFGCVHSAFQSGQRAARTICDQLCAS